MSIELNDLPVGVSAISDKSSELPGGVFIVKFENESSWRICLSKKLSPEYGRFSSYRFETEEEAVKEYLDKTWK
ncbi:hypothetical protein [Paenibacillus amylolyticus]|uniref:Uncharacterized protein n=1 Tax=Paenibacillus amylolyticus TaxID=1451 RepID=A0ABD8B209_PAEAM